MIANIRNVVREQLQHELALLTDTAAEAMRMKNPDNARSALAVVTSHIESTSRALTALAEGRLAVVLAYLSRKSKHCFQYAGMFACFGPTPESRNYLAQAKAWVRMRRLLRANRAALRSTSVAA